MAADYVCIEKRPLKRPRLGPPDVYPQETKQSEDELTPEKVNKGFAYRTPLSNEYESAKSMKLEERLEEYASTLTHNYNLIIAKKNDSNALQDIAKKKAGFKEPFWHSAAAKPKTQDVWFRDLAGSKPLPALAKKLPFFNKKDEILTTLADMNIPLCRAVWFIKMTNAYVNAQQESGKLKKKQVPDAGNDWMQHLFKFLKELLSKLSDYYSISHQPTSTANYDVTQLVKQWTYCTQLSRYMYEEGLFDKHEYLTLLLDIFAEKCRSNDDGILKLIIPIILKHMDGFLQYELHCRNLAYFCCKKLCNYYMEAESTDSSPPSALNDRSQPPAWYTEYMSCSFHRYTLISLSSIVHSILVDCPTALVWNPLETVNFYGTESSKSAYLCSSPLDHLYCFPSQLPLPQGPNSGQILNVIKTCEEEVRKRSASVDSHWSFDKCQQSGLGSLVSSMLSVLDTLDTHEFDVSNDQNNLEKLCKSVFPNDHKENIEESDKTTVTLLCHWAVTAYRFGDHRALAVVRLLERRRQEIDDMHGATSDGRGSRYSFQQALFEYLDTEAPAYSEKASGKNLTEFSNLIILFGELIRADLFSHDQYISALISRGDLTSNTYQSLQSNIRRAAGPSGMQNMEIHGGVKAEQEHDFGDTRGDADRLNSDIERILDRLDRASGDPLSRLEKQPLSVGSNYAPGSVDPQFPPSVESQSGALLIGGPASIGPVSASMASISGINNSNAMNIRRNSTPSKHCWNVLHFPIPSDEQYKHERNQRQALMFGFGAAKEKQKHTAKKMIKELNKLWHKKNSMECSTGGVLRSKRKIDVRSLKALLAKFRELIAYDQHAVIDACSDACLDQLRDFVDGKTNYLPSVENVDFFMGIMEIAKNIGGLMEFIEALIMLLSRVERQLQTKGCGAAAGYVLNHALCSIGFLRKYESYLALCSEETANIWSGLFNLLSTRPLFSAAPSAERCSWNFLRSLYENCEYLQDRFEDQWTNAAEAFGRSDSSKTEPVSVSLKYDPNFMAAYFENPKKRVEEKVINLLDNGSFRYSFVVNSFLAIINNRRDNERLYELAQLCADVSALHPSLGSEWLGALKSLCCSMAGLKLELGYYEILAKIELSDYSLHYPLTALVFTLVGRGCIRMEDLVLHVCLQSLVPVFKQAISGGSSGRESEAGARLTLHIFGVLCLARDNFALHSGATQSIFAKMLGHTYLVCSAQSKMVPEALLVLLIMILVLGDAKTDSSGHNDGLSDQSMREALGFKCEVGGDVECDLKKLKSGLETKSIGNLAFDLLQAICQQEWIKTKFCHAFHATDLFTPALLLDPHVKHGQAQKLLHMIIRGSAEREVIRELEQSANKKEFVAKVFRSLTLWNLSTSLLDLQLLLKQAASTPSSSAESQLIDIIGRATMEVFQGDSGANATASSISISPKKGAPQPQQPSLLKMTDLTNSWLIAPLVERLTANVQGRVLKAAAAVLEAGQFSRKEKTNLQHGASLLGQQPFLLLVLTCLRGQDEQRDALLNSLLKQLQEYVTRIKEDQLQLCSRSVVAELTEALQLRFSLVGGMFETIFRSPMLESWALLLLQLMMYGIVSVENDSRLFYACLDMLTILLHSCLVVDLVGGADRTMDEGRKLYSNIIRKARKEILERRLPIIRCVDQLMPIHRQMHEVIVCEPYGSQPPANIKNAKGLPSPSSANQNPDMRKGLQVSGKEKVNPWDIIEGYRGDNGLKWSWFQAVKLDHQPDSLLQHINRLLPHDHYHQCDRRPLPGENRSDPYLEPLKVRYDESLRAAMEAEKGGPKEPSGPRHPAPMILPPAMSSAMGIPAGMGLPPGSMSMGAQEILEQLSPRAKAIRKKSTTSTRGGRKSSRGGMSPIVQYGPALTRPLGAYGLPQPGPPPQPPSILGYPPPGAGPSMLPQQASIPGPSYGNVPPSWASNIQQPQPPQAPPRPQLPMSNFQPRPQSGAGGGTGHVVGVGKQAIAQFISQRSMGGHGAGATGGIHGGGGAAASNIQQQQHQFGNQHMNPSGDPSFGQSVQQAQIHMEQHRNQLIQEGMADSMARPPMMQRSTGVGSSFVGQQQSVHMMQQQAMFQQSMQQQQQSQPTLQSRPPPAYPSNVGMGGQGARMPGQTHQQQSMQQQQPRPPGFMYQQQHSGGDYNNPATAATPPQTFYTQQQQQQQQSSMLQQSRIQQQERMAQVARYGDQMTQNQAFALQQQQQQVQQRARQVAPYMVQQQHPSAPRQQSVSDQMAFSQQQQVTAQQQQQQMYHQQMQRQMPQYGGMPPGDGPQGPMYY